MTIFWRYALQSYTRIFSLSVFTFIAVFIIARFKEIARFTALSGDAAMTGLFILYHIPTILPIAIPISALIASLLLYQKMSRSFELIALRASGLSLKKIIAPPLAASMLLSVFNFALSTEIAPFCKREGKTLIYHETSTNPLLLLQRQKLVNIKDTYLKMRVKDENWVKDLILIALNGSTGKLNLMSAKQLWLEDAQVIGDDLSILSYIPVSSGFDHLVIENQSWMSTSAPLLSNAMKRHRSKIDTAALSFKMLRLHDKPDAAFIEMLRRISLTLAPFSFTFLGLAFGIDEGRTPKKKNLIFAMLLALTVLVSYLLGKELKNSPLLALIAFSFPHPFIWLVSSLQLYRITRGAQ